MRLPKALSLINKCIKTKSVYLDLGNCGLKDADFSDNSLINNALKKCTHLETLILSKKWFKWAEVSLWDEELSRNNGPSNKLSKIPECIKKFINLKTLILSGDSYTSR